MIDKKIQILIVDDSKVSRDLMAYIIGSDTSLQIVGFSENGEEALEFIKNHRKPDVIVTDIVMPKMDGFTLTKRIMQTSPIPIIIVSGVYNHSEVAKCFQAITAGAITIIEKPKGIGEKQYLDTARFVIETIKALGKVKMEKLPMKSEIPEKGLQRKPVPSTLHKHSIISQKPLSEFKAIAIGASLGGPQALAAILSTIPTNFPVPILIAQHISLGFMQGLANWLSETSFLKIQIAKHGEKAKPGFVYIAPDRSSMEITKDGTIRIKESSKSFCESSIGTLFRSMALELGPQGIGILLTGIGTDGPEELLLMKDRGAVTLVQDEKSCVRADLPQHAIKLGAAQFVLPLHQIAGTLEKMIVSKNQIPSS